MKILLFCLFVLPAFAQHSEQPTKEPTTDLRDQTVVFSIEDVQKGRIFFLEKTPSSMSLLRKKEGNKDDIRKIDRRLAEKLDREFAGRFLKCQYEIPASEGECKVTLRLTMKGEGQEICSKDEKKTQEITSFVDELNQRF